MLNSSVVQFFSVFVVSIGLRPTLLTIIIESTHLIHQELSRTPTSAISSRKISPEITNRKRNRRHNKPLNSATKKASKHSAKHKPTRNEDERPTEEAHHHNEGAYKARRGYTNNLLILFNTHTKTSTHDILQRHSPQTPSIKVGATLKTYTKDYISKIIPNIFLNKSIS